MCVCVYVLCKKKKVLTVKIGSSLEKHLPFFIAIVLSLIKDLSAEKPLSESVLNYLSKSLAELGENPDHTEVYKVLKKKL